jgi:CubicO group peptidase (beta-lactamase class C family)
MCRIALAVLALIFSVTSGSSEASSATDYRPPPQRNDGWRIAHAQSMGVDPGRLAAMSAAVRARPDWNVHAILIERNGHLIYEAYFDGEDAHFGMPLSKVSMSAESMHDLQSINKSVVSALVGIALSDGAIASLDQPLIDWFKEYPELDTPARRRITLANALSMTAGFDWNEDLSLTDPRNDQVRMFLEARPLHYALSRPIVAEAGSVFKYNGGLTQAMAAVVQRASKTPFQDYARVRLFEPLDIVDVEWLQASKDVPPTWLRLHPRDLAKFGSLYLHRGQWNGKQVIPSDWTERSTRRQVRIASPAGAQGENGYGYYWWYFCAPAPTGLTELRAAIGDGGQRVHVYPGMRMVVTILAGRYNDPDPGSFGLVRTLMREHVFPAVKSDVQTGCPGAGPG